jgi:hypothetical protein
MALANKTYSFLFKTYLFKPVFISRVRRTFKPVWKKTASKLKTCKIGYWSGLDGATHNSKIEYKLLSFELAMGGEIRGKRTGFFPFDLKLKRCQSRCRRKEIRES